MTEKEQEKRMEGHVSSIMDRGVNKNGEPMVSIELETGGQYPSRVWAKVKEAGVLLAKGGVRVQVKDYIVFSYFESSYTNQKTGQPTTSKWVQGEVEIFKQPMKKPEKLDDFSQAAPDGVEVEFKPASELKPLDSVVAERVKILEAYRAALKQAMQRELKAEECGWLSTLFIDHMKEMRVSRKYGEF
jgi:hypothetical protein